MEAQIRIDQTIIHIKSDDSQGIFKVIKAMSQIYGSDLQFKYYDEELSSDTSWQSV